MLNSISGRKGKQLILTKIFEFGGSNAHLATLIRYFGRENIVLILEDRRQLPYLENVKGAAGITVRIHPAIHPHAHLQYRPSTNLREFWSVFRSLFALQLLSARYGFAEITLNVVEPERHLYLFWLPFTRVTYFLHTTPLPKHTPFTAFTCRNRLSRRRNIITVSRANKKLLMTNWEIPAGKSRFVHVVYNCLICENANTNTIGHQSGGRMIVTLGQVISYKNPEIWLKVAIKVTALRPDVRFHWLGNGPLLEEYKEKTREGSRISFEGLCRNPGNYLDQAVIYYQPSLQETHGIAVVEAMSYHLPCIVANIGGLPESVIQGYNGLVTDPLDADAQIAALLRLLDEPATARRFGNNGYLRYLDLFTYNAFRESMDAVYAQ